MSDYVSNEEDFTESKRKQRIGEIREWCGRWSLVGSGELL
jgi:hypothetical protein